MDASCKYMILESYPSFWKAGSNMFLTMNTTIWLYSQPIDFRKQIDGLAMLIADHLNLNPSSGHLFLFRNRTANKLKILWWDRNGFWLCYKRLEKGRFIFPAPCNKSIELTSDHMSWLLSGLDFMKQKQLPEINATKFF